MSTYLQLCQRLRSESGTSGTNTSVPTSISGAAGEWGRLCDWVSQAWSEIQEEHENWEWMRKNVTFNTVAQQSEYTPTGTEIALTDFGSWRKNSFRAYLTSAGVGSEQRLGYKGYEAFRDYYMLSSRRITYARPTEITVAPNKSLMLGLAPDADYTVSGEYFKTPQILSADADTPEMPARFHMLIVYRAMMSYGAYNAANEVYQRGEAEYKKMLNKLRMDQLPGITRGGSLI